MIRKETRVVFITKDGTEFENEGTALKHEIKYTLDTAEGVYLQSYQIGPLIKALLADFTITPINRETQEI